MKILQITTMDVYRFICIPLSRDIIKEFPGTLLDRVNTTISRPVGAKNGNTNETIKTDHYNFFTTS